MSLLAKAVETYDANLNRVGKPLDGRDPLAPIFHSVTRADIEITIDQNGKFISARKVEKDEPKIVIPVTEESNVRTSSIAAHPLCDKTKYVLSKNAAAHREYVDTLKEWAESDYGHPFLDAVYAYIAGNTILDDLEASKVIEEDEADEADDEETKMICWRVINDDDQEPAVWKNEELQKAYIAYTMSKLDKREEKQVCMISGELTAIAASHPKKILPGKENAKLISSNDNPNSTYKGRFDEDWQASSVGCISSQKAHNALQWLMSDQGVREFAGSRMYLCWNPEGKPLPMPSQPLRHSKANTELDPIRDPTDYKKDLERIIRSVKTINRLEDDDHAVITAIDAATKGRLSVVYYNDIFIGQFLDRMKKWDSECCWYNGAYGIESPSLFQIVDSAFGIERETALDVEGEVQKYQLQRILSIKMNGGIFPADIVRRLVQRASSPQRFESGNWRKIMFVACAVLQKFRHDMGKGGDEMSWELDKKDRSFQFGRLLAVAERVEEDFYIKAGKSRQTNAIKNMFRYRRTPWTVFEWLNRWLSKAYLERVEPWSKKRYEKLRDEICEIIREFPDAELNDPLDDTYLIGYEIQRNDFFKKNKEKESES